MARISFSGFTDPVRRPRYIIWTIVGVLAIIAVMIPVGPRDLLADLRRQHGVGHAPTVPFHPEAVSRRGGLSDQRGIGAVAHSRFVAPGT